MNSIISSILTGVVAGLTTAVTWAGFVWIVHRIRNRRLLLKLQHIFALGSFSLSSKHELDIILPNRSNVPVNVREVRLSTVSEEFTLDYVLSFKGFTYAVFAEDLVVQENIKIPNKPELIEYTNSFNANKNMERFPVLLPQTEGKWSFGSIEQLKRIENLRVILEFNNLFGSKEIVKVLANSTYLKKLNRGLKRHKNESAQQSHAQGRS